MAAFIYSEDYTGYDFGPKHPLRPERVKMTYELLSAYNAFDCPDSVLITAQPAVKEDILLAHTPDYIEAVQKISNGEDGANPNRYGFSAMDNPAFPGMYEASLLYTGASIQGARLIASGSERFAFNISGGLHHAMPSRASGFCVFNDPVIAIRRLLETFDRVTYIDIDGHHADGVQEAFYTTNQVLTVSIHESGEWLFPGTGFVHELGEDEGRGYNINAPLVPYSGDSALFSVLREAVFPIVKVFDAPVIVAQIGGDGYFKDPLTHLNYSLNGWLEAVREILQLGKPIVALGGGGYYPSAICRMWTLAYSAMIGVDFPDEIPGSFADKYSVETLSDRSEPSILTYDTAIVERNTSEIIKEIKRLIFPYWPEL